MKKNWLKILLCMAVVLVVMTCTALAADTDPTIKAVSGATIGYNSTAKTFTVSYTGADLKGGQYVLLLAKLTSDGTDKAKDAAPTFADSLFNSGDWQAVSEQSITYIDQTGGTGTVTFPAFAPKSTAPSVVLLGGAFNSPTTSPKVLGVIMGKGVSVGGEVTSYNGKNPINVKLYAAGDVDGTVLGSEVISPNDVEDLTTQSFSISGVADGNYDMVVTKAGHLSYTITNLKVDGEDIDLTDATKAYKNITLLCGDMDDGDDVNAFDLADFKADYGKSASNASNPLTDCDGDGSRNAYDLEAFKTGFGKFPVSIAY